MRTIRFSFLTILLSVSAGAFSCLNTYVTLRNGMRDYSDPGIQYWKVELDLSELNNHADELMASYRRSDSWSICQTMLQPLFISENIVKQFQFIIL
jgi:hypothetical protein